MKRDYEGIITLEPGKRSGQPTIRGMRITVGDILEMLASGMSEEAIIGDFPELTTEDIRAALSFAAHRDKATMNIVHEAPVRPKSVA